MKMRRTFGIGIVATLLLVLCFISFGSADPLVSKPGVYSGYSNVLYDGWVRSSQYVTVRDGTKIALDIYRPTLKGAVANTPYPVIFQQTQYRRSYYANGKLVLQGTNQTYVDFLTKYGYVFAVADARGIGASYGQRRGPWSREEAYDTYDIIEWLADQPWSNGNIGMWGLSYMGGTQVMAASTMPPHLKAIFPAQTPFDNYDELLTIIPANGPFGELSNAATDLTAAPVDADTVINSYGYPSMLYAAVQEHLPYYNSIQQLALSLGQTAPPYSSVGPAPYRDSYAPLAHSQYYYENSASTYLPEIKHSHVAVYNMGYWNNWLRRGSISAFENFRNPSKLILTATSSTPSFSFVSEHLRFFDYWLKGINNGIMGQPPIYYNTLTDGAEGTGWHYAWKWPLPNEKRTRYYLQAGPSGSTNPGVNDGVLSRTVPTGTSAQDDYTVFYGITPANQDAKGITYTTDPLTADMEITGHPVVHLWISSTQTDGDFVASLEEITAAGKATVVASGSLRASLRKIVFPPYNYMGLPWRRALEADEQKLTPGTPVELKFDLLPLSNVFSKGNRIRLTIVCDSSPNTPHLSPVPVVSIYRNMAMASYITLPVTTDPIRVRADVKPDMINLKSHGEFTVAITPPYRLGKGYGARDIDISTLRCNGAPAVRGTVERDTLIAKFNTQDLVGTSAGPAATFSVTGKFNYDIPFSGTDKVRVMK
ncbi:MAG TPA: CocE/NonD family hydrolase [Syntrophorhabdaceae bacterium]|nr:CocE/NonD family hydrolase [Syntrophorhabdaceae bacterium]